MQKNKQYAEAIGCTKHPDKINGPRCPKKPCKPEHPEKPYKPERILIK